MKGFEKTHFRWKDPGGTSKEASNALRSGLSKLIGVTVLASTVFLVFLSIRYDMSMLKPLVALIAIISFIFVIYTIDAQFPRYVVLKDTHLYSGLNDETAEEWKYNDISHYRFSSKIIDGRTYDTLEIETRSGEQEQIIVASEISVSELRSFLLSKGIREE